VAETGVDLSRFGTAGIGLFSTPASGWPCSLGYDKGDPITSKAAFDLET
jgi:hypothetical protein